MPRGRAFPLNGWHHPQCAWHPLLSAENIFVFLIWGLSTHFGLPGFSGGLGESGTGSCLGKASFDAFSHRRSVVYKYMNYNNKLCDNDARYAPCTPAKVSLSSTHFPYLPQETADAPVAPLLVHELCQKHICISFAEVLLVLSRQNERPLS